jgi:BolA protein
VTEQVATRVTRIRNRLEAALQPLALDIDDESHLHAGHAGARSGKGHFRVRIVSEAFHGLGQVQRHRLVYQALEELLETDIHALAIQAATPNEIA